MSRMVAPSTPRSANRVRAASRMRARAVRSSYAGRAMSITSYTRVRLTARTSRKLHTRVAARKRDLGYISVRSPWLDRPVPEDDQTTSRESVTVWRAAPRLQVAAYAGGVVLAILAWRLVAAFGFAATIAALFAVGV